MTVIQKNIGRLPVNLGDYDSTRAYGKKNRVLLYGCEWESKVDNNTYAPATLNTTTGVITTDTTHWKLISGSYNTWLIDNGYQKLDASNVEDGNHTQHEINEAIVGEIGDNESTNTIKGRITTLEGEVGTGGSVDERIAAEGARHYLKSETYTKSEVNGMITTPNQEYVSVEATEQTTAATDVLPATGAADTIYRVANWDGSQYDASVYSEYAWNGTQYIHLSTKTQIGEVFDISAYHATGGTLATYTDLADALTGTNGGVPQSLQKGGMSVKFVQSVDNKYVQYRYTGTAVTGSPNPFLDTANNWQTESLNQNQINLINNVGVKINPTFTKGKWINPYGGFYRDTDAPIEATGEFIFVGNFNNIIANINLQGGTAIAFYTAADESSFISSYSSNPSSKFHVVEIPENALYVRLSNNYDKVSEPEVYLLKNKITTYEVMLNEEYCENGNITYDNNENILSYPVKWIDGKIGVFTNTNYDSINDMYLGYEITYDNRLKLVQPSITVADGIITNVPSKKIVTI